MVTLRVQGRGGGRFCQQNTGSEGGVEKLMWYLSVTQPGLHGDFASTREVLPAKVVEAREVWGNALQPIPPPCTSFPIQQLVFPLKGVSLFMHRALFVPILRPSLLLGSAYVGIQSVID